MPSAAAGKKENELKAHLDGNKLDLSLMQHEAITPTLVRQIGALPKATEVDLSCNRLQSVAPQFCSLSQITHLDLSKNAIRELPEEIGQMTALRSLDLSGNKIVSLPLSFGELENLRWLDLKDNPLEPHLAAVTGDCLDKKQCTNAAKQVCVYMRTLADAHEKALEKKKKKKDNLDEKKQRKKEEKERALREEQKAAKKLEKEKKRKEYEEKRLREQKQVENIGPMGDKRDTDSEAEVELRRRAAKSKASSSNPSILVSLLLFLLRILKLAFFVSIVCVALTAAVVGWCQGSRRTQSPVCASTREAVQRLAVHVPAMAKFDFDAFCDEAGNQTREVVELARERISSAVDRVRPWVDQYFAQLVQFYDAHVSPMLVTLHEKSHCVFCHVYEHVLTFYREQVLPTATVTWARVSDWSQRLLQDALVFFNMHVRPTLIVIRDRLLEVYLLILEHFLRICDVYVFPGCEKILASAADIFQGLKASA